MTSESDALIQELVLRGFADVVESDEYDREEIGEYADAMDEFLDETGAGFIRNAPGNVQEFWDEYMEEQMDAQ